MADQDNRRRAEINRQERQRVHNLNYMYNQLQNYLPHRAGYLPRRTRVEILREATSYIRRLQNYLNSPNEGIDAQEIFPDAFTRTTEPTRAQPMTTAQPLQTTIQQTTDQLGAQIQTTNQAGHTWGPWMQPSNMIPQPPSSTNPAAHHWGTWMQPSNTVPQPTSSRNQTTHPVVQRNPTF